jgi:hypothetical protein
MMRAEQKERKWKGNGKGREEKRCPQRVEVGWRWPGEAAAKMEEKRV